MQSTTDGRQPFHRGGHISSNGNCTTKLKKPDVKTPGIYNKIPVTTGGDNGDNESSPHALALGCIAGKGIIAQSVAAAQQQSVRSRFVMLAPLISSSVTKEFTGPLADGCIVIHTTHADSIRNQRDTYYSQGTDLPVLA